MEIKYLGANAIKKVFSIVKGWIATAKAGAEATAKAYAYSKGEADAKFQTEAQVTTIAEAKAAAKAAEVVASAPETLDTLKEIADFLTEDTVANGLVKQLATKADKSALDDYQKKADMPTFTEYTDTEIDAIAAEVAAA